MSLKSWFKGWQGEAQGAFMQWMLLDDRVYRRLNNVTLADAGGTTQIDHIIVSAYGIFVIETKNMSGWIFGEKQDKIWTQKFGNGQSYRFQNPLLQNHRHVHALAEFLGLPLACFHSVVMFWGEAQLKSRLPENVMTSGYIGYIKSKKTPLLEAGQVAEIVQQIVKGQAPKSLAARRAHVRSLQERLDKACPLCQGRLVARTAKHGARAGQGFWGCANYPACRHTQETA